MADPKKDKVAGARPWLVIEDGTVINSVLWDGVAFDPGDDDKPASGWSPPEGCEAVPRAKLPGVDIGWIRIKGEWTAPVQQD